MAGNNGRDNGIVTALIYTRVSSDEQKREGLSLDVQLRDCRRYVGERTREGQIWRIGGEYQDVLSGMKDGRQDYQRLLTDVRRLRAEGQRLAVVVAAMDRFGRKILERVRCREELKELGVSTHSAREGGEVSDIVANVLAAVAQEEVRRLGERVSASRQYSAELGWMPVGEAAWGYGWRDRSEAERALGAPEKVLEIDPESAPFVAEAFRRVAAGESFRSVARWVRSLPAAARSSKPLYFNAVLNGLRSPTYISRRPGKQNVEPLLSPITRWPRIVEDALWATVQLLFTEHAKMPMQASGHHLMTGLARCPECGARMDTITQRKRTPRLRCSNQNTQCRTLVVAAPVEQEVLERTGKILAAVASPDGPLRKAIRREWERLRRPAPQEGETDRRAALEQVIQRARLRITRGTEMFIDGDLARDRYNAVCAKAEADIAAAATELATLGAPVAPTPLLPDFDTVMTQVGDWAELLRASDTPARRNVLGHLIEHVVPRRRPGVRSRRPRPNYYEVEIVWTNLGCTLREITTALAEESAA